MRATTYANALVLAGSREGSDEAKLVSGLVAHLKQSGRMKLLPSILVELKKAAARRQHLTPQVEVASAHEAKEAVAAASKAGIEVKEATVNPSLITGWRARSGGALVDTSGKQALVDLYRHITK